MKKSVLTALLLITSLFSWTQAEYGCEHQGFKINDTAYVWKHGGAKLRLNPTLNAAVLTSIPEGHTVKIAEEIDSYFEKFRCVDDTIFKKPLIVIHSPFIKVNYGSQSGYIIEHYVKRNPPFERSYLEEPVANQIFNSEKHWPGDYSEGYSERNIYNNGVVRYFYFGGKVNYEETFLVPQIDEHSFQLVALKFLMKYGVMDKEKGVYFEGSDTSLSWSISDPKQEDYTEVFISITLTRFGMLVTKSESGGC